MEIPPQEPHFAMQIKSRIFPGDAIIVEAGKLSRRLNFVKNRV